MRRGFSLLEAVISCSLLLGCVLAAFGLFEFGSAVFRLGNLRNGLQAQARRAALSLEGDLRRADYGMMSFVSRSPNGRHRDGLCLPTLRSWSTAASFDSTSGRPRWDGYLVIYATGDGRLIRQLVAPPGAPYTGPWVDFSEATNLRENPATNAAGVALSTLADQVEEFRIDPSGSGDSIRVLIQFRGLGGRRPAGGQQMDESLQVEFQIHPENTL
ncbi:MAG: hypothetical protein J0I12_15965 [Candidatus Eremiobacteraeota bacterium]|nr:hypothetical protein [Candidatus Eremiobacteraeota bacterium]